MNDEVANCALILSDLALVKNDIPAFRNLRSLFFAMTDTLANQSLVHATQELETRYETEKKEQQILQLEREREIQQLRLQQKNVLMWGFAGLSGLFLLIGFLSVRNLRHRRRLAEQVLKIRDQEIAQIKQEQQLYVADALLKGQEEERSRLAKDLHDGLGGLLSGIRQTLNGTQKSADSTPVLSNAIEGLDGAIRELRNVARNMMPEALTRFGLKDALRDYCDHLSLGSSAKIHFQAVGFDKRLPQKDEVFVFRIAQELLNNTIKHAEASQVIVQLDQVGDRSALTIEDDGKGFDRAQLAQVPGVGWQNIQSRVEYLGGSLDLRTAPGKGTSVRVEI
jgi:Signal transduction histidine kinase